MFVDDVERMKERLGQLQSASLSSIDEAEVSEEYT